MVLLRFTHPQVTRLTVELARLEAKLLASVCPTEDDTQSSGAESATTCDTDSGAVLLGYLH
jgi:hypothetical protein